MKETPSFNNRHNEEIQLIDKRTIWLSRSCAVVAHVTLYDTVSKQWYILLGKRGVGTPDFQGYWGLPCGYLDWDETLTEAMIREVWEECGVYLPNISQSEQYVWSKNSCVTAGDNLQETPWAIADTPRHQKQNISMHYAVQFAWEGQPFPDLSDAHAEPDEVAGIEWVLLKEAFGMDLAFNHAIRIRELWDTKREWFSEVENKTL